MRDTPPDYSVRCEALLRIFCLWVLPEDEALAQLQRDRAEYVRRFYSALLGWCDWAAEQIAAGTLQPGGPLPTITNAA